MRLWERTRGRGPAWRAVLALADLLDPEGAERVLHSLVALALLCGDALTPGGLL